MNDTGCPKEKGTCIMKKIIWIILIGHAVGFFVVFQWLQNDAQNVVKYFPLDETVSFEETSTSLKMLSESDQDEYEINWTTNSKLKEPVYLRQDISLLYEDGRLKGVLGKWKENSQDLVQEEKVQGEDSGHYQAITYHHGEIHYPDDRIKSIQDMTQSELYVIDSPLTPLESFTEPENQQQIDWKETLDRATQQQLAYRWNQLVTHFSIPLEQYERIPLTTLPEYKTKPLPGLDIEQTQQVIGQLWEGLYKNYILDFTASSNPTNQTSYVPLILADKDGKHLLVLYENARGKKEKLLQYYPEPSSSPKSS